MYPFLKSDSSLQCTFSGRKTAGCVNIYNHTRKSCKICTALRYSTADLEFFWQKRPRRNANFNRATRTRSARIVNNSNSNISGNRSCFTHCAKHEAASYTHSENALNFIHAKQFTIQRERKGAEWNRDSSKFPSKWLNMQGIILKSVNGFKSVFIVTVNVI